jgi:TANK-binding kinase 1
MNQLHSLKIVHRDIKPNNILLTIKEDGEHVYKLSDFGAAREIFVDDQKFDSICGTEEYLFPELYERALINKNIQRSFRAEIDLWSTGVTLYHIATGVLPFRPLGGRQNRSTMMKILEGKASGNISGVQNPITALIEYSNELPEMCQLSKSLRKRIEPMLAGLMETAYDKMWTFEMFFKYSNMITNQTLINVLNANTCQINELQFEKNEKLIDLKTKIEIETTVGLNSQFIISNNLLISSLVDEDQTIETYPLFDSEHPLVLISLESSIDDNYNKLTMSKPSKNNTFLINKNRF